MGLRNQIVIFFVQLWVQLLKLLSIAISYEVVIIQLLHLTQFISFPVFEKKEQLIV